MHTSLVRASTKSLNWSILTPFLRFLLEKCLVMGDLFNQRRHAKKDFLMKFIPCGENVIFWVNIYSKNAIFTLRNKSVITLVVDIISLGAP